MVSYQKSFSSSQAPSEIILHILPVLHKLSVWLFQSDARTLITQKDPNVYTVCIEDCTDYYWDQQAGVAGKPTYFSPLLLTPRFKCFWFSQINSTLKTKLTHSPMSLFRECFMTCSQNSTRYLFIFSIHFYSILWIYYVKLKGHRRRRITEPSLGRQYKYNCNKLWMCLHIHSEFVWLLYTYISSIYSTAY